ncbi:MAG TPA: ABC transporter ATP-binding protein [Candidatus Tectomicrobia bacterium]
MAEIQADAPMIAVHHLRKAFAGRIVLEDVSFTVARGTVCVVMGGSGSGKSTILRHLIGAYRPDAGQIYLDGEEITCLPERDLQRVRRKFGMLFQGGALLNSLTVGENVALPIRHHTDLPEETIAIMVKLKLELVGLRDAEHLKPSQLSGGMQKRISLARAIALDPKIVFYDEPSAGLDPIVSGVIDTLMVDLTRKMGITSVVVTHDMASAFRIADHMIMLHRGRIVASGTPDEIRQSDNPLVQQFITGAPDGPIPLRLSQKDYQADILGL